VAARSGDCARATKPLGVEAAVGGDHAQALQHSGWPRNPRIGAVALIGGTDCLTSLTFVYMGIVASEMPLAPFTVW
jgi:hypothetical protein